MLFWDNQTVINYLDQTYKDQTGLPATALSLPVNNPMAAAIQMAARLKARGYTAEIVGKGVEFDDLPPNHLAIVRSDAFDGWVMIFRRPLFKMPRPRTIDIQIR